MAKRQEKFKSKIYHCASVGKAEPLRLGLGVTPLGERYMVEDKSEQSQHAAEESYQSHLWREEEETFTGLLTRTLAQLTLPITCKVIKSNYAITAIIRFVCSTVHLSFLLFDLFFLSSFLTESAF